MWYVLQTVSGKEEKFLPDINRVLFSVGDCTVFLPKFIRAIKYESEWHMEKKVLFPGYIFVSTQNPEIVEKRLGIFTAGVKPVCIGGGFNPIRPDEQEFLEGMMNAEHEIESSIGDIVNGELIVHSGPLKDKEHLVTKVDRHRRYGIVRTSLWGEACTMLIGLEVVRKT